MTARNTPGRVAKIPDRRLTSNPALSSRSRYSAMGRSPGWRSTAEVRVSFPVSRKPDPRVEVSEIRESREEIVLPASGSAQSPKAPAADRGARRARARRGRARRRTSADSNGSSRRSALRHQRGLIRRVHAHDVPTPSSVSLDERALAGADVEDSSGLRNLLHRLVHPAELPLVDRSVAPMGIEMAMVVAAPGVLAG